MPTSVGPRRPDPALNRSPAPLRSERHAFTVETAAAGRRLDAYLAAQLPGLSRSRLQRLIAGGHVVHRGRPHGRGERAGGRVRPAERLRAGDRIEVEIPPPRAMGLEPEPIPLDVVYEDAELLVINKPAGLTVHPGAGRQTGTLVHAILAYCPTLPGIGGEHRPGIVHRLDKDTSGLLVVAKTERALRHLQAQIQSRRARRDYRALVHGRMSAPQGRIDAPVGRDPRHRTRMAVVPAGRTAVTHYRVVEAFDDATALDVRLETGRTHQIRVHCAFVGHPVVGDPVYGRRPNPWGLARQALHAHRLAFVHPVSGLPLSFTAPLPADMTAALRLLRRSDA